MADTSKQSHLKAREIQRAALAGLALNIFLSVVKGYAGIASGSRALLADAVHSLSDLTTDIAVIVGARFWCRPPDESHPMGHRGIETAVSLFIGLMLLVAGFGIGIDSVKSLGENSTTLKPGILAVSAALLSLVAKEFLFRWTMKKARTTGSGALAANAWHHRSDGFSSIPVLIAVTASMLNSSLSFLDSIGGAIVSIFILKTGWKVLQPVIGEVTNSAPPGEVVKKMIRAAESVEGVISIHRFRARMQGGGIYVDLHLQIKSDCLVGEGYFIGKQVEKNIHACDSSIRDVIARVEPYSPCGDTDSCRQASLKGYLQENQ